MTDSVLTRQLPPLPTPLTSFVGRERDLDSLVSLLQQPNVRLVTLTGPGGVGKTRLALRVASTLQSVFPDGVIFVPLAAITNPDLVGSTIAQTLGVREQRDRPTLALLADALGDCQSLLLLDNFEQIVEAGSQLTDLLVACPNLHILVTSRILLRLSGEHDYPIRPLPLPASDAPLIQQVEAEAIRLFADRARAADPTFAVTVENAHAIAAICRRLDGLPLALELVAAHVRTLSPQALLPRLANALPLLTNGRRDDPARLRTMRDAIAWSYHLLTAQDQSLFQHLAIFSGGFTLDAAEVVARGLEMPMEVEDVLAGVISLVEQSLVQRSVSVGSQTEHREPRFGMLETVREFGLERLEDVTETAVIRDRHARHFLDLAEAVAPDLEGPAQPSGVARLDNDLANLRAALTWFSEHDRAEEALRMATTLAPYWSLRGRYGEGRAQLEAALALPGPVTPALRARALARTCHIADWQADYGQAVAMGDAAVAIWRELDDRRGLAEALLVLGLALIQVDVPRSEITMTECVELYRSLDDDLNLASALDILGICAYVRGDYVTAAARMEQGLLLARSTGDPGGGLLGDLGHVSMMLGDHQRARQLLGEGLVHFRRLGHRYWIAWCLASLAGVVVGTQPERAVRLFAAATDMIQATTTPLRPFIQDTYAPILANARVALGDTRFTSEWARGQALTLDEAIAEGFTVVEASGGEVEASSGERSETSMFGLTPREAEVLKLVAAGHANSEIAARLFISVPTVKRHVSTILGKLDLPSRPAAVAFAHTHHLT